ncbi:aldo/keto reductase family oxidoreductase [Celerinatantimonas diazotrophica]|uniref:Aryl-alcohol dehydrogenase-like predicted oxidoreductase n=1 Tax=Celerinatantimonas diazotrophica TaxID=412034 RepID=A0A4R1JLE7_9GAMM|nr:aldo/keto reductase family oxidoreductase [Celerinatantimonas diazotrophica]TCK51875.1 aryl-alcohol dehydrogenase-like predicted oxidoreductase [Celerinatantimonas diazotrophica]CAG9296432.1 Pyridoxine 4-dehydrogenase [Celerinatantimonas diazotrophica]
MTGIKQAGTFQLGDREVYRMGYGAMQLAGPGVFGEPKDPVMAKKVLQKAITCGINHIDTSDFYGPHITNQLIAQALKPYPSELTLVTKIGARRDDQGNWLPAFAKKELIQAVHDNLQNLGVEQLEVVNLRAMFDAEKPAEGSISEPFQVLSDLKKEGLIRHLGVSHVTYNQVQEAQSIDEIVCVQNCYNIALRHDDALIDKLAQENIAYVPFFPLGGFTPLQSSTLDEVAKVENATPMQVALAWLLQRSPNILLIPGTSSMTHLHDNLAASELTLSSESIAKLNQIGSS